MKKFASILVIPALVLALCVPAWAEETPVYKIGHLPRLAETEEEAQARTDENVVANEESFPEFAEAAAPLDFEYIEFQSLNEMLLALDAGQIQQATLDEPTAQYILSRTEGYAEHHPEVDIELGYSMLFLEGNAALRDSFNAAIAAMREDGTLDKLVEQYIDGVIAGAEPEAVAFPSFDGADTISVAVTGDLPPMDYVDDAGNAAGFNTAVLAEIANRLEINIELSQIDSGARALALSSGRADVVFWTLNSINQAFSDIPEGTISSDSYYIAPCSNLARKATPAE